MPTLAGGALDDFRPAPDVVSDDSGLVGIAGREVVVVHGLSADFDVGEVRVHAQVEDEGHVADAC